MKPHNVSDTTKTIVRHIFEDVHSEPIDERRFLDKEHLRAKWSKFYNAVKDKAQQVSQALKGEVQDTKDMVSVFAKHFVNKVGVGDHNQQPTPQEVKAALQQLKQLPQFAALAATLLSPLPGTTLGYLYVAGVLERIAPDRVRLLPDKFSKHLK